jgi:glycerol-3-phosphate dehydrogenase
MTVHRISSREHQLDRLARSTAENPFDVLIIGGGASGTGCAVDAVTRCVTVLSTGRVTSCIKRKARHE